MKYRRQSVALAPACRTVSAERAANQGLPTIDSTGNIHFKEPPTYELGSDPAVAQAAVNEMFANHHLTVTCKKCTKTQTFSGVRKADAVQAAWMPAGSATSSPTGDRRFAQIARKIFLPNSSKTPPLVALYQ
jgi:hypothetical protein